MGRRLPCGITQCYLPPDTSERASPNPSRAGWYSIYLPRRDGRLNWPSWLDSAPARSWTSYLSITSPMPNHWPPRQRVRVCRRWRVWRHGCWCWWRQWCWVCSSSHPMLSTVTSATTVMNRPFRHAWEETSASQYWVKPVCFEFWHLRL